MLLITIVLIAFLPSSNALSSSRVTITKKGYSGLVIAINPEVEESEELIAAIQETWTDASRDLYTATKGLSYFKEITILVPKSWDGKHIGYVTGSENYDQADVVITLPDERYGNEPYTEQHGGCGEMGIRSHFTTDYLLSEDSLTNYGPRGKVVVHEWAHYRWGIFDEISTENPFYWHPEYDGSNGPEATRCPITVYGEARDVNSINMVRRCNLADVEKETNTYPSNCVFFPFEEQYYHSNTSMMCYHFMDEVVTFCHDGNDDEYNIHNKYAPNEQNRLCELKSTWSVIMQSQDFRYAIIGSGVDVADTTPVFKVVKPGAQRSVLVLDKSGSMGDWKLEALRQAAYQFITVSAPNGSYVGIVQFDSTALIRSYLKQLNSDADRENLALLLPDSAGGGTCIGCGIEYGIDVLESFGSPAGGHLVIITDGQGSGVNSYYNEVLQKGIIVDTVYIETDENALLTQLTEESGGVWYLAKQISELQNIFNELSSSDSTETNSYQLHSEAFYLVNGQNSTSIVAIDKTIGLHTVFVFTWNGYDIPTFYIKSPQGCYYTNDDTPTKPTCSGGSIHSVSVDFKTVKFLIPGIAEVGEWLYTAISHASNLQQITSVVTSEAASNDVKPILVESGMSQTAVTEGSATVVYAKVTQGYNPLLGATAIATVNRPNGGAVTLDLFDNGAGSDIRANDGIYSRYFTQYYGQGRYSVELKVSHADSASSTTKKKNLISRANYNSGTISSDGSVNVNPNGVFPTEVSDSSTGIQSDEIGEFSRVVSSGGFSYTGSISAGDSFPPVKIIDASLRQNDLEDYSEGVIIKFTAPGDDLDSGTANLYEIRYTYDDPTTLSTNFTANGKLTQADFKQGDLNNPQEAGSEEIFIFEAPKLPEDNDNIRLAVAIRAVDEAGNEGAPSNIALTNFFIKPLEIGATMSTKSTTTKPACPHCEVCDPNIDLYMYLMVGLAITTAIFLTSTVIISVWLGKVNNHLEEIRKRQATVISSPYEMMERNRSRNITKNTRLWPRATPSPGYEEETDWRSDIGYQTRTSPNDYIY